MRSARLGLVVTKRGNPKAVRRNRLKRLIREQFRLQANNLPEVDVVVQVFGQVDDAQFTQQLHRLLLQIARRLPPELLPPELLPPEEGTHSGP